MNNHDTLNLVTGAPASGVIGGWSGTMLVKLLVIGSMIRV